MSKSRHYSRLDIMCSAMKLIQNQSHKREAFCFNYTCTVNHFSVLKIYFKMSYFLWQIKIFFIAGHSFVAVKIGKSLFCPKLIGCKKTWQCYIQTPVCSSYFQFSVDVKWHVKTVFLTFFQRASLAEIQGKRVWAQTLCFVQKVVSTLMILSFRTDRPGQTVQTQIRLLLEEQSDQSLHCLPFHLHRLDSILYDRATQFKF